MRRSWLCLIYYYTIDLEEHPDNVAEWLRRLTRNQLGLPAQVQVLPLSLNLFFQPRQACPQFRDPSVDILLSQY